MLDDTDTTYILLPSEISGHLRLPARQDDVELLQEDWHAEYPRTHDRLNAGSISLYSTKRCE